jgi:hypothetical protein
VLECGDRGGPVDPGADVVALGGGDGVDEPGEGGPRQPVPVADQQVDRRGVGQAPAGRVRAQQPSSPRQ